MMIMNETDVYFQNSVLLAMHRFSTEQNSRKITSGQNFILAVQNTKIISAKCFSAHIPRLMKMNADAYTILWILGYLTNRPRLSDWHQVLHQILCTLTLMGQRVLICHHFCLPCTLPTARVLMTNARLTSLLMILHRLDRLQTMMTETTCKLSIERVRTRVVMVMVVVVTQPDRLRASLQRNVTKSR